MKVRHDTRRSRPLILVTLLLAAACAAGCGGKPPGGPGGAGGPGGGAMAMPVAVMTVENTSLHDASEYVATLKSRHTTNVQPQVEGVLTRIFVKSGDRVKAGAPLMQIDPEKQRATVSSQEATRAQKLAALNYAREQLKRQETLYQGGAASKQQLDEAQTSLAQAQADYDATGAQVREQEVQLAYYKVAAPAAGVVGDIPVRVGDRVTFSTLLTTIDQNDALELYISVPIERSHDLKLGLPVEVLNEKGAVAATTQINFISPQVDEQTQQVLVKAPVASGLGLRSDQFMRARVVWSTHPGVVVPVLAVSRVNGQFFVFAAEPAPAAPAGGAAAGGPGAAAGTGAAGGSTAPGGAGGPGGPGEHGGGLVAHQKSVQLGDLVGNDYVVLSGLQAGDRIVAAGVQKLADGMPIMAMPAGPPPPAAGAAGGSGGPGGAGQGGGPAGSGSGGTKGEGGAAGSGSGAAGAGSAAGGPGGAGGPAA
jgi:RND family efflux transporter MFP subunit